MKALNAKTAGAIFCLIFVLCPFPSVSEAEDGGGLNTPAALQSTSADKESDKGLAAEEVAGDTYVIGPSDVLDIQVWKEPDLSSVVLVRTDGMITIPLINDVKAAGHTPPALKKEIERRLKQFVEVPEVSVIVKTGQSHKIYVIGKVQRPGEYLLSKDMTVLQTLALAGGLTEWADSDNIIIIRRIGSVENRFCFDYKKVISGRDPGQNIYLEPNDTIIIP